MGNDCSCLNDLTSLCSEDLSQKGNNEGMTKLINNNPNSNLMPKKYDSMRAQTNETNSINSNQTNLNKRKKQKQNNNKKNNIKNNKNNINNKNTNNIIIINNRNNNIKPIDNIKFEQFLNSPKAQEMSKESDNNSSYQICMKLHKYFLKIIKKKAFLKNIKKYKEEGENLFNSCVKQIYKTNEILLKVEQSCKIKYSKNGYNQFYPNITPEEEERMKYTPDESKTIDNSIIIYYQNIDDNSSNINEINNVIWIYKGQADINNIPNGYGVKYNKNGMKQEGFFKDDQLTGWSQSIDYEGNILMGPFIEGKITGKGIKYSFLNNALYKGDIVQNKKEGKGEEISNEGKFIGNFLNDKKNGEGKMIFALSGDIYEGNYKDDLFDGKGHYKYNMSGQEYTGEYKNGLMHGKGLYEWSEGEFYRGNFVNGKKEGNGEMHWADGRSFIGPFINGRPQGIGIFDNGLNYKGEMEFIDGKLNRDYLSKKYRGSESNSLQSSLDRNDNYL